MKKIILSLIFPLMTTFSFSQQTITTIPVVQQWTASGPDITFQSLNIQYSGSLNDEQRLLFKRFKKELDEIGIKLVPEPTSSSLNLLFTTEYSEIAGKTDAYEIKIHKQSLITSSSYKGLLYSTRTLLQLFSQEKYAHALPGGLIRDYPEYEKRMLLLDVARKFFTIREIKDFIVSMAWVKMNELHLHLSDNSWGGYSAYRLESAIYPQLTAQDGHYSWEEIAELQNFARSLGISIIPEIDSPGHSRAFTRIRPDLASPFLGEKYLDITNAETYPFMESILAEVIPHFYSSDFHLGTDEYRINRIKDDSLKYQIGNSFRKYINHFNEIVRKLGKRTRIWSGFERMPGETTIARNIIIDMWETSDARDKSVKGYDIINSSHFYTYIVPGAPYYGVDDKFTYEQWTPEIFSNKAEQNLSPGSPGLLGSKMHIWNDFGPTGYSISEIARSSIPSMIIFSQKMWGSVSTASYADFCKTRHSLLKIPCTRLLSRNFSSKQVLYSLNESLKLQNHKPLPLQCTKRNAEYPWKVDFTLKRTSESEGKAVLLSSSLAVIYSDLEHTFKRRKNKQKFEETKRGFAIVRANQTAGPIPLESHKPDILIFNYQLPLDKTVHITLMGEKNKTSLYIEGSLIDTQNTQMICPVEYLGSAIENVFPGIISQVHIQEQTLIGKDLL